MRLRLSEILSSEIIMARRGHASQHKIKSILQHHAGNKISKIQWAHEWDVFSPYYSAFHFFFEFSSEKKNVNNSSGVFICQENGY